MKKNDYKYLACAVALSLSMGVGSQSALAAVDPTTAPMGVGVDLNSGKSATMNSEGVVKGSLELPDESSVESTPANVAAVPSRDSVWAKKRLLMRSWTSP